MNLFLCVLVTKNLSKPTLLYIVEKEHYENSSMRSFQFYTLYLRATATFDLSPAVLSREPGH